MRTRNKSKKSINLTMIISATVMVVAVVALLLLLRNPKPIPPDPNPVNPISGKVTNAVEPTEAWLFFDPSISMKGYVDGRDSNGTSGLLNVISDLRNVYPTNAILDGKVINGNELYNRLYRGSMRWTDESLLQNYFAEMVEKVHPLSSAESSVDSTQMLKPKGPVICFFVTDGILSYGSKDVSKNRDINIVKQKELQNKVEEVFKGKPDIGVSVYQFCTNFHGTYYCYNNSNKSEIDSNRFFYVFAVGEPASLAHFKQQVQLKQQNEHGFSFVPVNQFHVIDPMPLELSLRPGPSGSFSRNDKGLAFSKKSFLKSKNKYIEFSVDLSSLKNIWIESFDALIEDMLVTIDGRPVNSKISDARYSRVENAIIFSVHVNELSKQSTVKLTIPYSQPRWIASSSNDNDLYMLKPDSVDSRTFLFERLMNGICNGLGNSSTVMAEAEVTLINLDK